MRFGCMVEAMRGVVAGLAMSAATLLGGGDAAPACPAGSIADPARARAIAEVLRGAGEPPQEVRVCFAREAGILPDGTVLLERKASVSRSAARLAHLVSHGPMAPRAGETCDAWVSRALDEEARAHGVEMRLARRMGDPPPFDLSEDPRAIRDALAPTLGAAYAARCVAEGR